MPVLSRYFLLLLLRCSFFCNTENHGWKKSLGAFTIVWTLEQKQQKHNKTLNEIFYVHLVVGKTTNKNIDKNRCEIFSELFCFYLVLLKNWKEQGKQTFVHQTELILLGSTLNKSAKMLVWRCWLCTIHYKDWFHKRVLKEEWPTQNHRRGQTRDVDSQLFVQTWPYHSFHVTSYRLRYLFCITPMIVTKFRKTNVFKKKVYTQ